MRLANLHMHSHAAIVATAVALLGYSAARSPTLAFGGAREQPAAAPACPKGYVEKSGKCVRSSSGVLPDDELIRQGRALALAKRYEDALDLLRLVQRRNDPVALTYTGYSLRKMGHADEGIAFYMKALAIDPDNADTREYLGEGYVAKGRLDLARGELARVLLLSGKESEQYIDLESAIAGRGAE